jgi:hypothetical protein
MMDEPCPATAAAAAATEQRKVGVHCCACDVRKRKLAGHKMMSMMPALPAAQGPQGRRHTHVVKHHQEQDARCNILFLQDTPTTVVFFIACTLALLGQAAQSATNWA